MPSLDPDIAALLSSLPPPSPPSDPKALRIEIGEIVTFLGQNRKPSSSEVSTTDIPVPLIPGCRLRRYDRTPPTAGPALLFFHGGGWVVGDIQTHDAFCRRLCSETGLTIISADYRLAPEHPFPAAALDAIAIAEALIRTPESFGLQTDRLIVAGDSAGATLAAAVCNKFGREAVHSLAGQLLIYPATDLDGDFPSRESFATGYFLSMDEVRWYYDQYTPDARSRLDPLASPLRAAEWPGIPPTLVVTAGFDPLRDEGRAYADALRTAGTIVHELREEELVHGFVLMDAISSGADRAVSRLTAKIVDIFVSQI